MEKKLENCKLNSDFIIFIAFFVLKKKLKNYKINIDVMIFIAFLISFTFFEMLYKMLLSIELTIFKFIYSLLYSLLLTSLLSLIKPGKLKKVLFGFILFSVTILYFGQAIYYNKFYTFALWNQIARLQEFKEVAGMTNSFISPNFYWLLLPLFIFIPSLFLNITTESLNEKKLIKKVDALFVSICLLFLTTFSVVVYSQNYDKIVVRNSKEFVENYGMFDTFVVNSSFPIITHLIPIEINDEIEISQEFSYVADENKVTGQYANKNLILILGESIGSYAIDEKLTPTLYEMQNEGYNFDNYYATRLNTLNSEYAVLNSFYLTETRERSSFDSNGAMPRVFKNQGYSTKAFHNYKEQFYYRNETMIELGFDEFYGQEKLNIEGDMYDPASDIDLVEQSVPYYMEKNEEPFFTYYITFSTHMPYAINDRVRLAENLVKVKEIYPDYNEELQVYLAGVMLTDQGIEALFESLQEYDLLDDTVVAFFGDHHAYALNQDDLINDMQIEGGLSIYKTPFIIWDNEKPSETIDKPMSMIDVLPTINNMFDLELSYTMGKDVFSDESTLVEWNDSRAYSFINEAGSYDGLKNETTGSLTENDVEKIKKLSYNRERWNDSQYLREKLLEIKYDNIKRKFYD